MNKMTGIILMVLGTVVFIIGAFTYNSTSRIKSQNVDLDEINQIIDAFVIDGVLTQREEQHIRDIAVEKNMDADALVLEAKARIDKSEEESETEIIDHIKKSGDDFEKYVVKKFNPQYFNVQEWAGDKYIDGIYADSTLAPDLKMEFKLRNETEVFSVECKWRSQFKNGSIQFARKDQFERYKKFEKDNNIPVFIALGVGGKANAPEALYVLPLRFITSNKLSEEDLIKYQKNISKDFFYAADANILK